MIEIGALGVVAFCVVVLGCSLVGVGVSNLIPWNDDARRVGLCSAAGVALGPFLLGFGSLVALGVFRGSDHVVHLGVIFGFVGLIGAAVLMFSRRGAFHQVIGDYRSEALSVGEVALIGGIACSGIALLLIAVLVPLTQNDALEYATAAREVYLTRDLYTYPVLDAAKNQTGFFGPWTHPPLYVALFYAADLVQGHAEAPGAIRLIAPWFFLCGAYLAYGIGALVSRVVGLAAALLFMSPPLFFLGAASALIDAAPTVGFALIIAVIVGVSGGAVALSVVVGGALGASLWTHSQALLFLPLAVFAIAVDLGVKDWRRTAVIACGMIAVALAIAWWPYWRNIEIFGAAVSDNPAVFALPSLYWDDYFSIGRGLGSSIAVLQYGVLKGLFAIEAYGIIFWVMIVGLIVILLRQPWLTIRTIVMDGAQSLSSRQRVLWLIFGLFCCYLAGTILSVVIGIDHMIKNERYLLVTLPMASVLAAYGLVRVAGYLSVVRCGQSACLVAVSVVLAANSLVLVRYAFQKVDVGISTSRMSMRGKLSHIPEHQLISELKTSGRDGLVLTLKPADLYYSDRRMLSYLDPRVISIYQANSERLAVERLTEMGVTAIHVPSYGLPPLYNSVLYKVIASPTYTSLLSQNAAGQLYQLTPEALVEGERVDVTPGQWRWAVEQRIALGGRKMLSSISSGGAALDGKQLCHGLPYDVFHRHWINLAKSAGENDLGGAIPVEAKNQYRLSLRLQGTGAIRLGIEQISEVGSAGGGQSDGVLPLTSFELSDKQRIRDYEVRFMTGPNSRALSIVIEATGNACIQIESVGLTKLKK